MASGRTYSQILRSISGIGTRPFWQLASPSATVVEILRIEMGVEEIAGSNIECVQLVRRLRNSTIPNVSNKAPLNPNDPGTLLAATSITNCQGGAATGEGSYTASMMRWSINTVTGLVFVPAPDERPVLAPSNFYALQFVASPAAQTWSGHVVYREIC